MTVLCCEQFRDFTMYVVLHDLHFSLYKQHSQKYSRLVLDFYLSYQANNNKSMDHKYSSLYVFEVTDSNQSQIFHSTLSLGSESKSYYDKGEAGWKSLFDCSEIKSLLIQFQANLHHKRKLIQIYINRPGLNTECYIDC